MSSGGRPPTERWFIEQAAAVETLELLVISALLRLEEEIPTGRLLISQILEDAIGAVESASRTGGEGYGEEAIEAMHARLRRIEQTLSSARA